MAGFNIDDYVTVPERVVSFYEKFPEGSLQSEIIEMNDHLVVVRSYAYRTPDDPRPGIGHSSLAIPGSTPYTKGSELENAETSAVGRAIAMLGFHVKKSIASSDEIRNKGGEVRADVQKGDDGSLIGTAEVGDRSTSDYSLRNTPDGPVLGFRLRGDKGGILVRTRGQLARDLDTLRAEVIGHRVTCWGRITTETFTPAKKGAREVSYQVLDADRVQIPGLPPLPTALTEAPSSASGPGTGNASELNEAESEHLFDEVERLGA